MIIVLMGYMGCGKSTVGKDLATILNYRFLDLDNYISDKENSSISSLFKTKGEIYFRKKESEYLKEILNTSENLVLALGGGTPCYANNLNILLNTKNVLTFYLKLSIRNLAIRLFNEKDQRPLISHLDSIEDLSEFIGKHLFERSPYYSQAENIINTDNKNVKDVMSEIVTQLI